MKNLSLTTALFAVALMTLSGCGHRNSDPVVNPNQVAAVDIPRECQQPQAQPQQASATWRLYRSAGCSQYAWDEQRNFRNGTCPQGTFAACGTGVGMVCVPAGISRTNQVAWFKFRQSGRSRFCGYEGSNDRSVCAYRRPEERGDDENDHDDQRQSNIARACVVGQLNSCGFGHCAPISRRSSIGVCAQ